MLTTRPRGTNDFLPGEVEKWQFVENVFRDICKEYAYGEIRTPIFEHTELFTRGVGETTDIVEKEMYTFNDRSNRNITLRPENTAPVVRAFLEHKLYSQTQPTKLYYIGPMFRYDKPQSGRYRQFHQVGIEILGAKSPAADVETIELAVKYLERLGLKMKSVDEAGSLTLFINSIGCPACRPTHIRQLKDYLSERLEALCDDCSNRYMRNPLRVLDCKKENCQEVASNAPSILDSQCEECKEHFQGVREYLKAVEIPFEIDSQMVRGLDYYSKTTFEITSDALGSQSSVCGGGRYDGLVELCGGDPTPGVGFALGIERLILTVDKKSKVLPETPPVDVFIASIGSGTSLETFRTASKLRSENISSDYDMLERSLRGQMKYADKINAKITLIIGEDELKRQAAVLRDMESGEQQEIPLSEVVIKVKELLK